MTHLAQTRFAISDQELQEIETDVATALPKMMARVFIEGQMAMQRFLAQSVPGMISRHTKVSKANDSAEEKFFTTNAALGLDRNNPTHQQTALRLAGLYRQANPQMPLEQLIAEVGPIVAAAVKATPVAPGEKPGTVTPTPTMPVAAKASPFVPAVNGMGGASPAPAMDDNPWAGLGQNFDE